MKLFSASLTFFPLAIVPTSQSTSELRWELASIAIGVVVFSIGLASLSLFFMQQKTDGRSLVFFSLGELARWSGTADGAVQEDDITLIAVDFALMPVPR